MKIFTFREAQDRIDAVVEAVRAGDNALAHHLEDQLHRDILDRIRSGPSYYSDRDWATIALQTLELDFKREY